MSTCPLGVCNGSGVVPTEVRRGITYEGFGCDCATSESLALAQATLFRTKVEWPTLPIACPWCDGQARANSMVDDPVNWKPDRGGCPVCCSDEFATQCATCFKPVTFTIDRSKVTHLPLAPPGELYWYSGIAGASVPVRFADGYKLTPVPLLIKRTTES